MQQPAAPVITEPIPVHHYNKLCTFLFIVFLCILEFVFIPVSFIITYDTETSFGATWGFYTTASDMIFQGKFLYEYKIFCDLSIMMLVGYGFVFSYLRFNRWTALGLTFFITMISLQYYVLFYGLWNSVWKLYIQGVFGYFYNISSPQLTYYIPVNLSVIHCAQKGAMCVLITLGALIGKVDFFQMMCLAIWELLLYTLNEAILFRSLGLLDQGGSMYIYMFGAFFGICVSIFYSNKVTAFNNPNNRPSYSSGTVAFIGTFFLWIFMPSFNAYNLHHSYIEPARQVYYSVGSQGLFSTTVAGTTTGLGITLRFGMNSIKPIFNTNLQFLAISNTYWALFVSTTVAFWASMILKRGKFGLEHVLYSTLAGGVMIGASSEMYSVPYPALIIGAWAGAFSVWSYHVVSRCMDCFGFYDTVGVFHAFGLPGVWGGIASAIAVAGLSNNYYNGAHAGYNYIQHSYLPWYRTSYVQGAYQIAGLLISLAFAIFGGIIGGLFLRIWRCYNRPEDTFGDHIFWEMLEPSERIPPDEQKLPPPPRPSPVLLY